MCALLGKYCNDWRVQCNCIFFFHVVYGSVELFQWLAKDYSET